MEVMTPLIIFSPLQCVWWMVVGGISGSLVHRLIPSRDSGLVKDVVLGLVGAEVGGLILKPSPSLFSPEIEIYVNVYRNVFRTENVLWTNLYLNWTIALISDVSPFLPLDFFVNVIVATFGACALVAVGRFVLRRHRPIE